MAARLYVLTCLAHFLIAVFVFFISRKILCVGFGSIFGKVQDSPPLGDQGAQGPGFYKKNFLKIWRLSSWDLCSIVQNNENHSQRTQIENHQKSGSVQFW